MNKLNLKTEYRCFFCGRVDILESHHIYGGANREKSERYGLVVYLCHGCHNEPPRGVHFNKERANILKEFGQAAFEAVFGFDLFIAEFGKSYSRKVFEANKPVIKAYSKKVIMSHKLNADSLQRSSVKADKKLKVKELFVYSINNKVCEENALTDNIWNKKTKPKKAEEYLNLRKKRAEEFKEAQKAKASENRKALYQKQKEWLKQRKAELIKEV